MNNIGIIKDSSGQSSGLGNSLPTKGKFQQHEDIFLKQNYKTKSLKYMSLHLNRTKKSISRRLSLLEYKRPRPLIKDISNEKFGKLFVLKFSGQIYKDGQALWECECDCGNIVYITGGHLRYGHTKSCGCLKHTSKSNSPCWKGFGEISGGFWCEIKNSARKRDITITIVIKDIWNLFLQQDRKCALTNLPLKFGSKRLKEETTASLDRIDSSKGYTIDNVQWLHKTVNKMKMDLTQDEFVEFCKLIAQNAR